MKMEGDWIGFYEYGAGYLLPYFGQRVNFRLSLTDTEDGFEGTSIEDDSKFAIKEISKISGFVEEGMISFANTYANYYGIDEESMELKIEIEGKEYQVNYSGHYDEKFDCFYGSWEIQYHDLEYEVQVSSGIWKMEKETTLG